jgi:hypothetical protein
VAASGIADGCPVYVGIGLLRNQCNGIHVRDKAISLLTGCAAGRIVAVLHTPTSSAADRNSWGQTTLNFLRFVASICLS